MNRVVEAIAGDRVGRNGGDLRPASEAVLHAETAPPLLQTFEQKMEGMERLGIEQAVVLHFGPELARVSARDFLRDTIFGKLDAARFPPQRVAFGHNREGGFDLLKQWRMSWDAVREKSRTSRCGNRVSSTMVRRLLVRDARISRAECWAGREDRRTGHRRTKDRQNTS
jgi:FAD synthase